MRHAMSWFVPAVALGLLGSGCDGEEELPPEFNNLPQVTLELRDGAPLEEGTTFSVAVTDDDGDTCSLEVEFSVDEGASYEEATISASELDLNGFPCGATSDEYIVVWDAEGDLGDERPPQVLLRVRPYDSLEAGPPRHLPVGLGTAGLRISGPYVQRPGAQFPQWDYLRVAMAHTYLESDGMTMSGEYLVGADELIVDGSDKSWAYDLPNAAPEEHLRSFNWDGATGQGAFYLPFAWGDVSPDGVEEPNGLVDAGWEDLLGISAQIVVAYILPDGTWTEPGWHLLAIDIFAEPGIWLLADDAEVPMNLKGYAVNGGTTDLEVIAAVPGITPQRRVGWLPPQDDAVVPAGTEELASTPFEDSTTNIALDVATSHLPASHWVDEPWGVMATAHATELLYLYEDTDGDHEASGGDPLSHVAVDSAGVPLTLETLQAEMTWSELWLWSLDDCWKGMNLVIYTDLGQGDWSWTCLAIDEPLDIEFVNEISWTDEIGSPH